MTPSRRNVRRSATWTLLFALSGCSHCGDGGGSAGGDSKDASANDAAQGCLGTKFRCTGSVASPCNEPNDKAFDCATDGKVCDEVLGCVTCTPGETSCSDGKATWCKPDGTLATFECDPVQGLSCEPSGCKGACARSEVQDSYIGCDYYPTMTLNPVWSGFPFAIAVSNAAATPTKVTITRGDQVVREVMVDASELQTFELPWVSELKGGDVQCAIPPARGDTRVVKQGAYRVRTDQPVTVYQFSPLSYQLDPAPASCPVLSGCSTSTESRCLSYSNDASLLLPANALTGNYTALSWISQSDGSGFVAITATEDGTEVTLNGTGKVNPGAGIAENGRGTIVLDRGDVLELVGADGSDVSGTRVRANKPVQVLGGHSCAYVPSTDVLNCDHIEETMLPEDTLGSEYLIALPAYADVTMRAPTLLRVAAIQADTEVSFDPALQAPVTLAAGTFVDVALSDLSVAGVHVKGSKPLIISTYMEGQEALPGNGAVGDPSMSLAVPIAQYRSEYLFTASSTYLVNVADVIAKAGASVTIDKQVIRASEFTPIGESGYGIAHVLLDQNSSVHTLKADQEVGLTVYGYGLFTSYMYPGGADLERITIPTIL